MYIAHDTFRSPAQLALIVMSDLVADTRNDVKNAQRRVALLREDKVRAQRIVGEIVGFIGADNISWLNVSPRYTENDTLTIHLETTKLSGMRDPIVLDALNQLMEIGWEAKSSEDSPASLTRTHYLYKNEYRLHFSVRVSEDSETCRKVQVGEEMRVVPKYEIKCD